MEIGSKIRELRLKADLTQEELGDRCELTKGYISQLENDVTSPSIATLEDIVAALGTTLVELFSESQPEQSPVYRADDYFVKENDGYVTHWLIHNGVINEMEPILVEIKAGCSTDCSPAAIPMRTTRTRARNSALCLKEKYGFL